MAECPQVAFWGARRRGALFSTGWPRRCGERSVGVIELSKAARGPVTAMPPPRQLVRLPSRTTALGACGWQREDGDGEADNGGLIRLEDDSAWRAGRVVCINECDARVRACVRASKRLTEPP